jgi:hypothetical protein
VGFQMILNRCKCGLHLETRCLTSIIWDFTTEKWD